MKWQQWHWGKGDNIGRDKIVNQYIFSDISNQIPDFLLGRTNIYKKPTIDNFEKFTLNYSELLIESLDVGLYIKLREFLDGHSFRKGGDKGVVVGLNKVIKMFFGNLFAKKDVSNFFIKLGVLSELRNLSIDDMSDLVEKIQSIAITHFINIGYYLGDKLIHEMAMEIFPEDSDLPDKEFLKIFRNERNLKIGLALYDLDNVFLNYFPFTSQEKDSFHEGGCELMVEFISRLKGEIRKKYRNNNKGELENSKTISFIFQIFELGLLAEIISAKDKFSEDDIDESKKSIYDAIVYSISQVSSKDEIEKKSEALGIIIDEKYDEESMKDFYCRKLNSSFLSSFLEMGYLYGQYLIFSGTTINRDIEEKEGVEFALNILDQMTWRMQLHFIEHDLESVFIKTFPVNKLEDNKIRMDKNWDLDMFEAKIYSALRKRI